MTIDYGFRVGSDDARRGGGLDPLPASQNSCVRKRRLAFPCVLFFVTFLQVKMSPKIVKKPFSTWSGSS
jgi:hypothetical protein